MKMKKIILITTLCLFTFLVQAQNDSFWKKINLKEEFEYFIKDKNVPLYDRWNAFWIADEKLKNNLAFLTT